MSRFQSQPDVDIQMADGHFSRAQDIEDGSFITTLDDQGHEQESEFILQASEETIEFLVLDYNAFKTRTHWVYENDRNILFTEVPEEKIVAQLSFRGTSIRKLATPLITLALLQQLPTAEAGPILAVVCATAYQIILNSGCGCLAFLLTPIVGPGGAILIGTSCSVLEATGGIPACIATCLALPTP